MTANGHNGTIAPEYFPAPDAGTMPPYNLDMERGVLGAMLLDNGIIPSVLALLTADDFFRAAHQVLYSAIADLYAQGDPADCVSVADYLIQHGTFATIGGDDLLAAVMGGIPSAANGLYHARQVQEKAQSRRVIDRLNEGLKLGLSHQLTAPELVARITSELAGIDRISPVPEDDELERLRPWPDPIDPAAWYGLAGEIVHLIAPHTEADPVAILAQLLVGFGCLAGRVPHWRVEATRHFLNLFLCVVGDSSKARKGTSWDHVKWLLARADEDWTSSRLLTGLSSGEGLIWSVRDPIYKQGVEVDAGEPDKRALFLESEFGSTLAVLAREGNTLSGKLREAWDSGNIRSATKNNPAKATDAHISVIAHITCEDLHRRLTQTDAANGFANRFLWVAARRSQFLPHGGKIHTVDFAQAVELIRIAAAFCRGLDPTVPLLRDTAANQLWEQVYPSLTQARPGLLGAVTSRGEAQAMRLAAIYAVLDTSKWIRRCHLEAGLALWRYCDQSAGYIFGESLGDPEAEKLLTALQEAGEAGLDQTQIRRQVFRGHKNGTETARILGQLSRSGLVFKDQVPPPNGGPKKTMWKATTGKTPAPNAPNAPNEHPIT